jgi:hypothetical protein
VVIFGLTPEKGRVTICAPALSGTKVTTIGSHQMNREQWLSATVFTGAHLPEGSQTQFSAVKMRTARLNDWTNLPRATHDGERLHHSLTVDIPSPVLVPVPNGEVALEWWETVQYGAAMSVAVSSFLCFRPSEPLNFETIWSGTLSPLFLMMCFFTGTRDRIESITLNRPTDEADELYEQIEVHVQRWGNYEPGEVNRHSFLVRYEDLADHLSHVLPAWLAMYDRTHLSMIEFFSDRLAPGFYAEDRFIRIARSMEMWHRDIVGGKLMESRVWKGLVDQAKGALSDPGHRQILRERLAHGNEPSLRRRLEEIVEIAGEPMSYEIETHPEFLQFVVTSRNSLTHGSKSPDPHRLVSTTYLLELTFTCALLRHLGLPESEVDEHIRRSELGMWLFWSRGNPWEAFESATPIS